MNNAIWYEKYRPQSINDYVFKNESFKSKMLEWVSTGDIPHIGFFGPAGTGKTSAINVLLNELEKNGHIDMYDVTIMNMSDEGIDAVRDKIDAAARLIPNGKYRVFVLEEMEQMNIKAQGSLKRIMEDYYENARFILTSNEPHKILKPIISRVQSITIEKHDIDAFSSRILDILQMENVDLSSDESLAIVSKYINSTYPDFRKTINTLQQSVVDGKIVDVGESIESSVGYRTAIIDALQKGNIRQMREIIVKNISDDEMDNFYSFLFRNVELFSTDEIKQIRIKVKIRDAVVKQACVSDREMNLSALLCEIDLIVSDIE